MSDLADFDREQPRDKLTRKQRAERLTAGPRGTDGLTAGERSLIVELRKQGLTIRAGWLVDRDGNTWQHPRVIEVMEHRP